MPPSHCYNILELGARLDKEKHQMPRFSCIFQSSPSSKSGIDERRNVCMYVQNNQLTNNSYRAEIKQIIQFLAGAHIHTEPEI